MKEENTDLKSKEATLENEKGCISPIIEVIEVEVEQSFFAGSGDLPNLPAEDWYEIRDS